MLNTGLSIYHKITFSDLVEFSKMVKQMGAKELISFGGYKPILVYYSRMPVDFTDKKEQIKKVRSLLSKHKDAYITGKGILLEDLFNAFTRCWSNGEVN